MDNDQLTRDGLFFANAYDFLSKYDWIFRTSNTEFIAKGILDQIPFDWTDFCTHMNNEDLNSMPAGLEHIYDVPASLSQFFERLQQLQSMRIFESTLVPSLDKEKMLLPKGISMKKYHEIQRLSTEVHAILNAAETPATNWIIIDLGCGLGYLSQLINHQSGGYRVLGIEGDASRVASARQRQAKYYPQSMSSVFYVQHFVQDTSTTIEFIEKQCEELFGIQFEDPTVRFAIIGLHACAALSVTAAQLFVKMTRATVLSIMPCCYHKMIKPLGPEIACHQVRRECIPLSRCMIASVTPDKWWRLINIPFLRLACQQSASRWRVMTEQGHNEHGAAMWDRALLQAVLDNGENLVASKCSYHRIDGCEISNRWPILKKYALRNSSADLPWENKHLAAADSIRSKHPNGPFIAELLTGLQASVQWLCEYVVLFDRVCYLKEQLDATDEAVYLSRIFCDQLSPRCFLLVARK